MHYKLAYGLKREIYYGQAFQRTTPSLYVRYKRKEHKTRNTGEKVPF